MDAHGHDIVLPELADPDDADAAAARLRRRLRPARDRPAAAPGRQRARGRWSMDYQPDVELLRNGSGRPTSTCGSRRPSPVTEDLLVTRMTARQRQGRGRHRRRFGHRPRARGRLGRARRAAGALRRRSGRPRRHRRRRSSDWAPTCTRRRSTSTDRDAVRTTRHRVQEHYGVVHQIYNNAGIAGASTTVLDTDYASYERVLDVNLWGVIHGTKEFLPHLIASGRRPRRQHLQPQRLHGPGSAVRLLRLEVRRPRVHRVAARGDAGSRPSGPGHGRASRRREDQHRRPRRLAEAQQAGHATAEHERRTAHTTRSC